MPDSYTITLLIPDKRLSPNHKPWTKGGCFAKSRAVKKAKADAAFLTLSATKGIRPFWPQATCSIKWYAKEIRSRDEDNGIAHLKAHLDGIAQAGLVANDSGLKQAGIEYHKDASNPRVEITITKSAPAQGAE